MNLKYYYTLSHTSLQTNMSSRELIKNTMLLKDCLVTRHGCFFHHGFKEFVKSRIITWRVCACHTVKSFSRVS